MKVESQIVPPMLEESLIRQVETSEDLVGHWAKRAVFHSMKVERVRAEGVGGALAACLASHAVTRAILNAHELEARFGLAAFLAARGIAVVPWGSPDCREAAFSCELALTDCRAGLADTGSIMVWSDATFGRSSTLVIPIHIVLLPASRILPDLVDGLAFIQRAAGAAGRMPSNVVLINGPSKTADIEMNLITGVHGPKHVYVVLIEGA